MKKKKCVRPRRRRLTRPSALPGPTLFDVLSDEELSPRPPAPDSAHGTPSDGWDGCEAPFDQPAAFDENDSLAMVVESPAETHDDIVDAPEEDIVIEGGASSRVDDWGTDRESGSEAELPDTGCEDAAADSGWLVPDDAVPAAPHAPAAPMAFCRRLILIQ